MCSGRVDPVLILQSLRQGIDGVAVLGCHPGDCHYQTGNYEAENKMVMTRSVLEKIGINAERLYLDWVSAAEGKRFSEVITSFTDQIRLLGPISDQKDFKERLDIGERIVSSERIRWLIGKQRELIEKGNVYAEKVDEHDFHQLLQDTIGLEYDRQRISKVIDEKPQTIHTIADTLNIPTSTVLKNIVSMENSGLVHLVDAKDNSPRYLRRPMGGD
jgi:coenzyme F420-reducing hydrogenase delta subunit